MDSANISDDVSWAVNELALRREMGLWIEDSVVRQEQIAWQGGHDEGTFTSSWCGYYLLTGDEKVLRFMLTLREGFLRWSRVHLLHGYYPEGEVHHQTENYTIFFARLWHLTKDEETAHILEDAAHHAGNWAGGFPPWYDREQHRFRSWKLGTQVVVDRPPYNFEVPDHFRVLQLLLTTYSATGKERYLALCRDYADRWCRMILEKPDAIPGVVLPAGVENRQQAESLYDLSLTPLLPGLIDLAFGTPERCVELHVAAGTMDVLLDLFELTGESRYAEAVKKMLDPFVIGAISDSYAEIPAMLLAKYRSVTEDTSLDHKIMDQIASMIERQPEDLSSLVMMFEAGKKSMSQGIGRRYDEIRWGYRRWDGTIESEKAPAPSTLVLAYHISRDVNVLSRALEMAAARLRLARNALRDGREHGCSGNTVSAVASGHGRAFGAGCVISTLYPVAFGALRFCGGERLDVKYYREDQRLGLPQGVAALFQPGSSNKPVVYLYNDRNEEVVVKICPERTNSAIRGATIDGSASQDFDRCSVTVGVKPKGVTRVVIQLGLR